MEPSTETALACAPRPKVEGKQKKAGGAARQGKGQAGGASAKEKLVDKLLSKVPKDPWGRPYQYNQPGRNGAFEIICFGADGREGSSVAPG